MYFDIFNGFNVQTNVNMALGWSISNIKVIYLEMNLFHDLFWPWKTDLVEKSHVFRVSTDDSSSRSLCGNLTDAREIYFPFLDTRDYFVYSIAKAFSLRIGYISILRMTRSIFNYLRGAQND